MDKLKETLEKAIAADMFIANGVVYHIDRVDCDEQVCYCHLWNGEDTIVDINIMSQSYSINFYVTVELP